jgi:hypothetical protein
LGAHATYACSHEIVSRRLVPTTHYEASNLLVLVLWIMECIINIMCDWDFGCDEHKLPLFAEFYVQPACAWIQFSWTHARPNNSLINYGHMHAEAAELFMTRVQESTCF